jgi:hypothetical protein
LCSIRKISPQYDALSDYVRHLYVSTGMFYFRSDLGSAGLGLGCSREYIRESVQVQLC